MKRKKIYKQKKKKEQDLHVALKKKLRLAKRGHDYIAAFVKNQHQDTSVDFNLPIWHDPQKTHFDSSPWRAIPATELQIDKDTIPFLLEAYRPISCKIKCPRTPDVPGIQESTMFHNSDEITRSNLNIILSQMLSKQCVRNLLSTRAHEYDWIVMSRNDFLNPIRVDLRELGEKTTTRARLSSPSSSFPRCFAYMQPVHIHPSVQRVRRYGGYHERPGTLPCDELVRRTGSAG